VEFININFNCLLAGKNIVGCVYYMWAIIIITQLSPLLTYISSLLQKNTFLPSPGDKLKVHTNKQLTNLVFTVKNSSKSKSCLC